MSDEIKLARGTRPAVTRGPQPGRSRKNKENSRTRVDYIGGNFAREPLAGVLALARYESALRRAVREHEARCVFVAVVDSDGSAARTRVLAPGDSAILGRHTQAHIEYYAPDLSLRQVAIAAAPSSSAEAPLVRVWDLATSRAILTEDGESCRALTADGPVFVTIGSLYLAVIPLSVLPSRLPVGTRALREGMPRREFVSQIAEGSVVQPCPITPPSRQAGRLSDTRITRMPAARAPESCSPEEAVAILAVVTRDVQRLFHVSAEALHRGVLVGRYERCLDVVGLPDALSRVHILIARIGPDVVAIDTASTYGSRRRGLGPFETAVLRDREDLYLANKVWVGWQRKAPRA